MEALLELGVNAVNEIIDKKEAAKQPLHAHYRATAEDFDKLLREGVWFTPQLGVFYDWNVRWQ